LQVGGFSPGEANKIIKTLYVNKLKLLSSGDDARKAGEGKKKRRR